MPEVDSADIKIGLWDQTLAFEFVKKHISAFGGNPANVTIYGESAGGGEKSCHMTKAF